MRLRRDYIADMAAAAEGNGWRVLMFAEKHPGGDGYVPHGVVIVEREEAPFGYDRRFVVASYNVRPEGVLFEQGDYDLTDERAVAEYTRRGGFG